MRALLGVSGGAAAGVVGGAGAGHGRGGTPGAAGAQPEVHAKGLEEHKAARLHYSAPADDGSVQERDEDADGTAVSAAPTGGSRAERRAAKKKNKRG